MLRTVPISSPLPLISLGVANELFYFFKFIFTLLILFCITHSMPSKQLDECGFPLPPDSGKARFLDGLAIL